MTIAIRRGTQHELRRKSVHELLQEGIFKPDARKISRFLHELEQERALSYFAFKGHEPVGFFATLETMEGRYEIKIIIVKSKHR